MRCRREDHGLFTERWTRVSHEQFILCATFPTQPGAEMTATNPTLKQATEPVRLGAPIVKSSSTQTVRTPPPAALGVFRGALLGLIIWILLAAGVSLLV